MCYVVSCSFGSTRAAVMIVGSTMDPEGALSFCVWSPRGERWSVTVYFGKPIGTTFSYFGVVPKWQVIADRDTGAVEGTVDRFVASHRWAWLLWRPWFAAKRIVDTFNVARKYRLQPKHVAGEWIGCPTNGLVVMGPGPSWLARAIGERVRESAEEYLGDDGALHDKRVTAYSFEWFDEHDDTIVRATSVDHEVAHLPRYAPVYCLMGRPSQAAADMCARACKREAIAAHRAGGDVYAAMHAVWSLFDETPGADNGEA